MWAYRQLPALSSDTIQYENISKHLKYFKYIYLNKFTANHCVSSAWFVMLRLLSDIIGCLYILGRIAVLRT